MLKQCVRGLTSSPLLPPSMYGWRGLASLATSPLLPPSMYGWRVAALRAWLASQGAEGKPVTMEMMAEAGHLDQFHYRGLVCNQEIATLLQVNTYQNLLLLPQVDSGDRLLDIGAGIGGPARYIGHATGCRVDGVDIQQDLITEANKVTKLVGLSDRVQFWTEDACSRDFGNSLLEPCYDGYYSILVNLHMPKEPRQRMFENIGRVVKETGALVIEDYVLKDDTEPLVEEEQQTLRDVVGVAFIPSKSEYKVSFSRLPMNVNFLSPQL